MIAARQIQLSPELNNSRQPIHDHVSAPLKGLRIRSYIRLRLRIVLRSVRCRCEVAYRFFMRTLFIMVSAIAGALTVAAFTPAVPESGTHFTDITQRAGIHFRHNAGKAGRKFLPETMGSGVAIFDFNGDGKLDLLFINSRDWNSRGRRSLSALYRNDGNGKFTDVTAGSGLDLQMYRIGVSTADYENADGRMFTSQH